MPILGPIDRKSPTGRFAVVCIYVALIVGGATMVYPFLVMLTGSVSNGFDYERRAPLPRYFWSREDRLLHSLCNYFPTAHRNSMRQLRSCFPDLPDDWQLWVNIGDDTKTSDNWAQRQLLRLGDPTQRQALQAAAKDYADFAASWDLRETVLAYDNRYVAPFLRGRYGTLTELNQAWEMSIDDFAKVSAAEWSGEPIDQAAYVPFVDTRYQDLLEFRKAYQENRFSRYLKGEGAYAGYLRPASLRYVWEDFFAKTQDKPDYLALHRLPYPVPADAAPELVAQWHKFLLKDFPMRHVQVPLGPQARPQFLAFLQERFRNIDYFNRVMGGTGQPWTPLKSWGEVALTPTVPEGPLAKVWMDFVKETIPVSQWVIRDTLAEQAFQKFALARHRSLEGINRAYGLQLTSLQQLCLPYGEAILVTFAHREWPMTWDAITSNYVAVTDYLFHRGLAVRNTIVLVCLAIFISLTVNPLAAYALSRFRLRGGEKIIIFCLATMAFPAAVAAIPGFLLLRDMSLLNTFAALVLPGAANGMTIFLLKGFFDSLPQELFEAATIDGAPEWQVFLRISLPLVKPILSVGMLNAFLGAYNGWEWAIIVCQDPKMWTIAVWTYQFSQTLSSTPYTVMAAFIVNSIPVLLVFLFCQKIILRGIILPQMK